MQRQREVNIVEKILAEERSLAIRKKQNPHLFTDRIKESYKVWLTSFQLASITLFQFHFHTFLSMLARFLL